MLALQSMCQIQLGDNALAQRTFAELDSLMTDVGKNAKYAHSRVALIAFLLRREAAQLMGNEPLTFSQWTAGRDVSLDEDFLKAESRRRRLMEIANLADANDWRRLVRTALVTQDTREILKLARSDDLQDQPPELVAWLASELRANRQAEKATEMLRTVYENHPSDFWVNDELGRCLLLQGESDEAIGFSGPRWLYDQ